MQRGKAAWNGNVRAQLASVLHFVGISEEYDLVDVRKMMGNRFFWNHTNSID